MWLFTLDSASQTARIGISSFLQKRLPDRDVILSKWTGCFSQPGGESCANCWVNMPELILPAFATRQTHTENFHCPPAEYLSTCQKARTKSPACSHWRKRPGWISNRSARTQTFPPGETILSPKEQAGLRGLGPEAQVDAFYHTWTQKEAFIKALGTGLNLPLDDFSVSVDPAQPGALLSINGSQAELSRWKMSCHIPNPGWKVAVCVQAEREIDLVVFMPEVDDFVTSASSGKLSRSV